MIGLIRLIGPISPISLIGQIGEAEEEEKLRGREREKRVRKASGGASGERVVMDWLLPWGQNDLSLLDASMRRRMKRRKVKPQRDEPP